HGRDDQDMNRRCDHSADDRCRDRSAKPAIVTAEGGGPNSRTLRYGSPLARQIPAARWGVTLPVTLAFSVMLGTWLMFAPSVLGGTATAANSDRLVGALIVTVAAISTAEVVRALRWLNALFGVWLLISRLALPCTVCTRPTKGEKHSTRRRARRHDDSPPPRGRFAPLDTVPRYKVHTGAWGRRQCGPVRLRNKPE